MSSTSRTAWLSTSFSEMISVTSHWRRSNWRPTAMPGNRCPPVPPQAMTMCFTLLVSLIRFSFFVRVPGGPRLPGYAQEHADARQHHEQVGPAVADERQRQALVG